MDIVQQDVEFFVALQALHLDNNRLAEFEALGHLPKLVRLHLSCNRLRALPTLRTGRFFALRELDISFNFVAVGDIFSRDAEWSRLPSLQALDASGNDLRALPEAIGSFPALRRLSLEYNGLGSECLKPLSGLAALQHLGLAHNDIARLPERVTADEGAFRGLSVLDVSSNRIRCTRANRLHLHSAGTFTCSSIDN